MEREPLPPGGDQPEEPAASEPSLSTGPVLPALAFAALVASAALFIPTSVLAHYCGYACASLIAFSAVAINRRAIVRSTSRTGRAGSRTSAVVSALLLLAGFALAVGHAWFIARHYG